MSGKTSVRVYERATNLSPKDRIVENKSFETIAKNEDVILSDYASNNGNVVNTDNFRPYFRGVGYNGSNSGAVQEPASYLAKKAFNNGLKQDGKYATFYAGGGGTGKTSAIKNIPSTAKLISESSVVLDGNLSSYDSAVKKIKLAVESGKKTPIIYVYRDPIESFIDGVVYRMKHNEAEMGRVVPLEALADNHIGSWETVSRMQNEGHDIRFIDNSLGKGNQKEVSFEQIKNKVKYPSREGLLTIFKKEAKQLLDKGEITLEQFNGFTGK